MKDKRKAKRQTMRYSAWIALENDVQQGCAVADISETGARIDVDDIGAIPECFTLMLSASGSVRRKCRVIWRQPHQIGVVFELPTAEPETAGVVPAMDADKAEADVRELAAPAAPAKAD